MARLGFFSIPFKALSLFALLSGGALAQPVPGGGCTSAAHMFCVINTNDSGAGSLRQAMLDSNTAGGANTIGFDIPGSGPHAITLASQMPTINTSGNITSLLVDGYSQPGSALNTNTPDQGGLNTKLMIELVGTSVYGFNYYCCPFPKVYLTYQGLAMHGFSPMIMGQTAGFTVKAQINLYGNFFGTTIDGSAFGSGPSSGRIDIYYDDAQIGGMQAWQRNVISGSSSIYGGTPNDSIVIEGNLIGTDASGTQSIPNVTGIGLGGNFAGLRVGCTGAGCTAAGHPSRNVISGNNTGMDISDPYGLSNGGLQIKGNYIGTDASGTRPLPNGYNGCMSDCAGIWVQTGGGTALTTIIGGLNAGEGNVVAYNNGPGIVSPDARLAESFDNQGNAIHNNRLTDIAFNFSGRIANDPGDADTGANNQQNYPLIQLASVSGNQLTVKYLVDTDVANATYPLRVDFYVDIDEGSGAYLVSDSYPATSAGTPRTVTLTLPASALPLVGFVASATTADGYSSELSPSYVFDRIFADGFEH